MPDVLNPDAVAQPTVIAPVAEPAPFKPTPQEWVDIYSQEAKAQGAVNPFTDWDASEIAEVAAADSEFDVVSEFQRYPELISHPETTQKAIDAFKAVRVRGFEFSDIKPGKVAGVVADIAKGFGKQIWNFGKLGATISPNVLAVRGLPAEDEFQNRQREIAESWSGIESSVSELTQTAKRGLEKAIPFVQTWGIGPAKLEANLLAKATGIKSPEAETPEESKKKFFDEVGAREQQEQILKGQGQFMQAVGGEVVKELEAAGKPVRPEESAALAAGDPFAWWTFGKAFQIPGKLVSKIPISAKVARAAEKVEEVSATGGGRVVQGTGKVTEGMAKIAKWGSQAGAILYGLVQGGPIGGLAGATGGRVLRQVAKTVEKAGAKTAEVGKQIATGAKPDVLSAAGGEIASPYAQLGRDIFEKLPVTAAEVGQGAAFDIGLAAATAETPQQTESVGIGAAFGAIGGARRIVRHAVSGQIVAPRLWGSDTPVPSSGKNTTYDAVHATAWATATPGEQVRINSVRQFLKGAAPDSDLFLLPRDEAAAAKALESAGFSPADASFYSQQDGFFRSPKPGEQRVTFVKNPSAAPHESLHIIQDVIGEDGLRVLDAVTKADYAKDWEQQGHRYANRMGIEPGQTWRDAILSKTGWGQKNGSEKLIGEVQARLVESGEIATPERVRELAAQEWETRRYQVNYGLTPEEAIEVSDRYLSRELQAENFDVAFKHLGPTLAKGNSYPEKLARVIARFTSILGGAGPLAGRKSEIGEIEPRFRTLAAVEEIGRGIKPSVMPEALPSAPVKPPTTPEVPTARPEIQEAKDWIDANPQKVVTPESANAGKTIADAINAGTPVKVAYWAAKGTPAGETVSLRPERRAEIEAQRQAENKDRQLVEHDFTPYRVEVRSNGPQFIGWSRDILDANTQKFSDWAAKVKDRSRILYETTDTGLTDSGLTELKADVETYMANQSKGFTGSGLPLVVPEAAQKLGAFKPEVTGEPVPLEQARADVINYLFNTKIPESAGRIAPLHLAGQEVSAATVPGRVEIPIRPRGEYSEAALKKAGITEPKGVREVNPFRQWVEGQSGETPSLIEVNQRLNLARIEQAESAARGPATPVQGNILTQAAGFQPKALIEEMQRLREMPQEEWKTFTNTYKSEKYGAGLTGWAFDLGAAAKTPEDLQAFRRTNETLSVAGREAMAAGQFNKAIEFIGRAQAAREAYEAATGRTLDGTKEAGAPFIREHYDPDYQPPMAPKEGVRATESIRRIDEAAFQPGAKARLKNPEADPPKRREEPKAVLGGTQNSGKSSGVSMSEEAITKTSHGDEGLQPDWPWRYIPSANTIYWWAGPGELTAEIRKSATDFLKTKGIKNPEQKLIYTEPYRGEGTARAEELYDKAHGIKRSLIYPAGESQAQPPKREFASEFENSEKVISELEKLRAGKIGGQTFSSDGQVWQAPEKPVDLVSLKSVNLPLDKISSEKIAEALGPYSDLLNEPEIAAGVYTFSSGGQKMVSVDVNAVVPQEFRENTLAFAKANDQISVWDAVKNEEVKAGGKGETRLATPEQVLLALEDLTKGKPIDVEALVGAEPPPQESQLPGFESRKYAGSNLTRAQKAASYPEAVITRRFQDPVASDIEKSPLAKEAGSREQAVESFSRKLVEFAREGEDRPEYKSGLRWYSEFTPALRKEFGKDAPVMAELLAATSPQTNPAQNFAYAVEALAMWKAGKFDKIIAKYEEGLKKIEDGSLRDVYARDHKAGKVKNPPANPSDATFLSHWLLKHDLTPRGATGKKFGLSSDAVLKVLTRRWLSESSGPKTLNFVENLLGTGKGATIDIWADRTLRRIGYEGFRERWRILPENTKGVSDGDFRFSQEVFRKAAKELGIDPSALQGGLWFLEKQLWSERGWGKLDLGDFRVEIKKLGMLSRGVQHRTATAAAQATEKEQEQLEIEPRVR